MPWRASYTYPFLFALVPVVRLVAAYPGWAELGDVVIVSAAVLAGCGLVYGLILLVTRGRGRRLAALVLFGFVLLFWGYARVAPVVKRGTGLSHPVLLPVWLAVTVGLIWWLARRLPLLDRAERFLTLTGGILIAWFVLAIGLDEWRSSRALRHSPLVRRMSEPIKLRPGAKVGPKRDIYLIVLDEYANAEVTGRLFGFDNHVFLDSLRQLGFVVPAVHSNYQHTFLSLPSLLNAAHVASLAEDIGRRSLDRTLPDHLVQHNRTVPFVKSQGYTFASFPSLGWEATRHHPEADFEFHVTGGSRFTRELHRSGFRHVLNKTSLLRYIDRGGLPLVRGHVSRTLAGIAEVPKIPGPVFTFAHVMSPHGPYVFGSDCGRPPGKGGGAPADLPAAYVAQVRCLDRMVLDMVTKVLRASDVPPVILLQGDHGSKTLRYFRAPSAEEMSLPAAKERLGAFGAYYLPDQGGDVFGDSVTVVNVMGNVLRYYLGADLPPEPDDMYLSVERAPFDFKRVDFAWLAREDWRKPASEAAAAH